MTNESRHVVHRGFTLLELLVCVAIIALLLSLTATGIGGARLNSRRIQCGANLHQLGLAFVMYAGEAQGRVMPLAYTETKIIGDGPPIYWWGADDLAGVDHTRGFVWPYLQSPTGAKTVFECPNQPWGTYVAQGAQEQQQNGDPPPKRFSSTYGYNGYYLSPPHCPGWSQSIGKRPWQVLDTITLPQRLFVFADTLIDMGGNLPHNNALLDPPILFQKSGRWRQNSNPTTAFRHSRRTAVALADGHVEWFSPDSELVSPQFQIGSVGANADPRYVPDWRDW